MCHPTPGSHRLVALGHHEAARRGVRLLAPDRPGCGASDLQRRRRLLDWADDVAALADHLGLARFSVAGYSGGGPHALAVAATFGDRVERVALVGSVSPMADPDPSIPPDTPLLALSRRSYQATRLVFEAALLAGRLIPKRTVERMRRGATGGDARVLARADVAAVIAEQVRHHARGAARAAASDYRIFVTPWGFDPADVTVPVEVWHGLEDRTVAPAHAEVLARDLPDARLHLVPGEGHLLLVARPGEILESLLAPR